MRNQPKKFIVYWTSKFNGNTHGIYTEQFKANMKAFDTFEAAKACHDKLVALQKVGGTYGQRIVYHVGEFNSK